MEEGVRKRHDARKPAAAPGDPVLPARCASSACRPNTTSRGVAPVRYDYSAGRVSIPNISLHLEVARETQGATKCSVRSEANGRAAGFLFNSKRNS